MTQYAVLKYYYHSKLAQAITVLLLLINATENDTHVHLQTPSNIQMSFTSNGFYHCGEHLLTI